MLIWLYFLIFFGIVKLATKSVDEDHKNIKLTRELASAGLGLENPTQDWFGFGLGLGLGLGLLG